MTLEEYLDNNPHLKLKVVRERRSPEFPAHWLVTVMDGNETARFNNELLYASGGVISEAFGELDAVLTEL